MSETRKSPNELVKEYFPDADDVLARSILWNCTGWPHFFAVKEGETVDDCLREQLRIASEKAGGDIETAFLNAESEMEAAMQKGREDLQREISLKAYYLWEAEGKPESNGLEFWLKAEQELLIAE